MKRRNWMKLAALLAVLLLLGSLSACAKKGNLLDQVKKAGKLNIGTEGDWSPWTYHDENDKLVGFDVELGTKIAEYLGVKPVFHETDWDSILAGVDAGRFDIACNGVSYTDDRAEKYLFSEPYAYDDTVLVVAADNDDIHSLADLKGKKTANTISSSYAKLAEDNGATVTGVNTLLETIELVRQGRVDATINAAVSINDYLKEHPDAGVKVVAVVYRDTLVFPVRKGENSETFIAEVNACLQKMRENGELKALSEKYFGMDITQKEGN